MTPVPFTPEQRRRQDEDEIVNPHAERCLAKSKQGLTCGLRKGHAGRHYVLAWGIPVDRLPLVKAARRTP